MKQTLTKTCFLLFFILPLYSMGTSEAPPSPEPSSGSLLLREGHDFAALRGTELISGDAVNASQLKANSVTVVNIWATSCPACIRKMPDLSELQELLPDKAGILGIVLDGSTRKDTAVEILETYGIQFPNMVPHSSMQDLLYRTAPFIPATVLVDSTGRILSGPHYGLKDIQEYLKELNRLL